MRDLAGCLRFYSRLPLPRLPGEADPHALPDFRTMPRMAPVAGAFIGAIGAAVAVAAAGLGSGPLVASGLAVAALVAVTGAFHEDGLADVADGFWGGTTRERRLEIMKDSRVGSYGTVALALALMLRVGALATLFERTGVAGTAGAMIAAAAVSRTLGLVPLALLPPARPDGASAAVGRPTRRTLGLAAGFALAIAALCASAGSFPAPGLAFALAFATALALGATAVARAKIGGQTGDVAGAVQQLAEIGLLIGLLMATGRTGQ
ncbi:adenosylcobinamide-GDP ribazoletransferase [Chelatococcus sp. SYSU_G07232]|uniref:Adenosylcobinamide-GDP ribazoletransferase n=1 Tax=Chelatococcus albus TaxID=3047466 RepID=A0ABT7AKA7_9HYPH|nr:adenosylcobinamide-GDP ribazoletransferase [Chelatococcus sp. SYSU_G07232]MDJ1159794.1 adenosylcobinamide-GDP ribazoletransferase [Chelatococcus sp. SYSU_G07232]